MDYAFVACDSWTRPFSLWIRVCPVGQHIEFAPDISLNYISIIAIELCNLWCVLLHSHAQTGQMHRCAKWTEAWTGIIIFL